LDGRTLVIGAGGFIGIHTARALAAAGLDVIGLGPTRSEEECFSGFFEGRSETTALLQDAVSECQNVIYLGGTSRPAVGMVRLSDEIARESNHVIDVAELCAASSVKRFVFASSGGTVYGATGSAPIDENVLPEPINSYGLAKLIAEHGLRLVERRTSMQTIALRISNPYGPGQRVKAGQGFIAAACQAVMGGGPLTIWGDGATIRDFVHINDVADAFVQSLCASAPPAVCNIGSGHGISLLDVCREIERLGSPEIAIDFQRGRSVDIPANVLAIDRAAQHLGWTPKIGFAAGLAETLDWWRRAQQ
jgi:UDP-glucose 4-epimerase